MHLTKGHVPGTPEYLMFPGWVLAVLIPAVKQILVLTASRKLSPGGLALSFGVFSAAILILQLLQLMDSPAILKSGLRVQPCMPQHETWQVDTVIPGHSI